jgi:gliding-associated putative ABC transporter substrate-binding component GldG
MAIDVKTKSTAGLFIIITAAILIILNLISLNLFARIDMTDDNIYSLSDVSKELVSNLNDRLTIKAFISDDLPSPHNNDARYLKDLLDDYKAYSNGYLQYEFIDPAKTGREEEAMGYRIPPLQFNVFRNDKTEFIKAYKGLVMIYGNKQETIPFIENTRNIEYEISKNIRKLITDKTPFIGFTIGNGEPDMNEGLQTAYQYLQEEYRVQFMNLDNLRDLPKNLDALFVIAPKEPLSDWELYLIDQFIMRGGRVCFMLDKFSVNVGQGVVDPINNNLDSLLYHYGLDFYENLVIDVQSNMVPVRRDLGGYQVQTIAQYPFYIKVSNFSEDIPIVKDIKTLDMLYASSLDLSVPVPPGAERKILFTSSDMSAERSLPIDVSPQKKYSQSDFTREYLPLGAAVTGRLTSFYQQRDIPEYAGPDTTGTTPFPAQADSTPEARLVAIGNATFITDDFRRNTGGFVLMMNIADWLTQDEGLIAIRSRSITTRTLEATTDSTKQMVKYANILLMPFLVIVFGVVRWQFRRSLRKREAA